MVRVGPSLSFSTVGNKPHQGEASHRMMQIEGSWVGGLRPSARVARRETTCEVITQIHVPPIFPPEHRVLLFSPEFGTDQSFDVDLWTYLEPEDQVDLSVVCWQGWSDFNIMIEQVLHKVLAFGDGVNTVWFGQGMGAIVAYELLKMIEKERIQSPNLPVALVVSDCPAPHLFAATYRPYAASNWTDRTAPYPPAEQKSIGEVVTMMRSYRFVHEKSEKVLVPILGCCHGTALADVPSVKAWEAYGQSFKFEDLGQVEEHEWYLEGFGPSTKPEPALLSAISETCKDFCRWNDETYPDIGPLDGPIPEKVDCIIVGAGIAGRRWRSLKCT